MSKEIIGALNVFIRKLNRITNTINILKEVNTQMADTISDIDAALAAEDQTLASLTAIIVKIVADIQALLAEIASGVVL